MRSNSNLGPLHHSQPWSTELFSQLQLHCPEVQPFNSINFTSSIRLNTITTAAKPDLWLPKTSPLTLFCSHLWIISAGLLCQTPLWCNPPTPSSPQLLLSVGRRSPLFASSLVCVSGMTSRSQGSPGDANEL